MPGGQPPKLVASQLSTLLAAEEPQFVKAAEQLWDMFAADPTTAAAAERMQARLCLCVVHVMSRDGVQALQQVTKFSCMLCMACITVVNLTQSIAHSDPCEPQLCSVWKPRASKRCQDWCTSAILAGSPGHQQRMQASHIRTHTSKPHEVQCAAGAPSNKSSQGGVPARADCLERLRFQHQLPHGLPPGRQERGGLLLSVAGV